MRVPNGGTLKELWQRAFRFLKEHTPHLVDEPIILVSHDLVGRILVCAVLGLPNNAVWRIAQDNAAITIFDSDRERYLIRTLNDTAHLGGGKAL